MANTEHRLTALETNYTHIHESLIKIDEKLDDDFVTQNEFKSYRWATRLVVGGALVWVLNNLLELIPAVKAFLIQ